MGPARASGALLNAALDEDKDTFPARGAASEDDEDEANDEGVARDEGLADGGAALVRDTGVSVVTLGGPVLDG